MEDSEPSFIDPANIALDALPYIDAYGDPTIKREVDSLLAAEMGRSLKSVAEYLNELPAAPELKLLDAPAIKAELDRIAAGRPQVALNTDRYQVQAPPEDQRDNVEAWRRAVDNACAQLEHQSGRLTNLELMKKFGSSAWKTHSEQVAAMCDSLAHVVNESKAGVESVNRKRKADQLNAKPLLDSLERQFFELTSKNNEIETVCWALEREVKKLRAAAGVPDPAPAPAPSA